MQGLVKVNNAFYDELGERWFTDDTHPIAVLRAEARIKTRYVRETLAAAGISPGASVLDVACGAGFVSLPLAGDGYEVVGIDFAADSVAQAHKEAARLGVEAQYLPADAHALPFQDASFDVVLVLDFLEHTEEPEQALREAARVLKVGGVLVFHTFNRTLPARLLAIHALEWVMKDAPKHIHVYRLFITPEEMRRMLAKLGLRFVEERGLRPCFATKAFWKSVFARKVDPGFEFAFTRSLAVGYVGHARK